MRCVQSSLLMPSLLFQCSVVSIRTLKKKPKLIHVCLCVWLLVPELQALKVYLYFLKSYSFLFPWFICASQIYLRIYFRNTRGGSLFPILQSYMVHISQAVFIPLTAFLFLLKLSQYVQFYFKIQIFVHFISPKELYVSRVQDQLIFFSVFLAWCLMHCRIDCGALENVYSKHFILHIKKATSLNAYCLPSNCDQLLLVLRYIRFKQIPHFSKFLSWPLQNVSSSFLQLLLLEFLSTASSVLYCFIFISVFLRIFFSQIRHKNRTC